MNHNLHNINKLSTKQLVITINQLLLNDFNALISILYKLDVSEEKLKKKLKENEQIPAAEIIAELIINREAEKQAMRKQFKHYNDSNEEKW